MGKMKTVLFLVLLFVGSNALRSNSHLRSRGDGAVVAVPTGTAAEARTGDSPAQPRPSPSGPRTDDETNYEDNDKLNQAFERFQKMKAALMERLNEKFNKCCEGHNDDEGKLAKCQQDFEKEEKDENAKIDGEYEKMVKDAEKEL